MRAIGAVLALLLLAVIAIEELRDYAVRIYKRLRDDDRHCAVCGARLCDNPHDGCVRGGCMTLPRPSSLYAPDRAHEEERHR